MKKNYVDVIGYQFEKVHTGIIAWLMNSANSPISLEEQAKIVGRFFPIMLSDDKLVKIIPTREYSFGRSSRIDLVLELVFSSHNKAYILIECKVDSDASLEQLKRSEENFRKENPDGNIAAIILALGAGQFTLDGLNISGDKAINLPKAVKYFSDLPIEKNNNTYHDWINALKAEMKRMHMVDQALSNVSSPWDKELLNKGYRIGFPIFYMMYDKIRQELNKGTNHNWVIYSGNNNPVMNWKDGWLPYKSKPDSIELYWEFNYDALCLKAAIYDETALQIWGTIREDIISLCEKITKNGRKTSNKKGKWVTGYKWDFDFCKDTPEEIASKTNRILSDVHNQLLGILK